MSDRSRGVLLALLHTDPAVSAAAPVDALDQVGWDQLLSLSAAQRVRPLVHRRLVDLGWQPRVPAPVWQALEQATRHTAAQTLRGQAELADLARELGSAGIPVVALKGIHLAAAVYKNAALREMNDVDILVRREHLQPAVDALLARGYAGVQPFSVELDAAACHQVTELHKPGAAYFEVHWNITKVDQYFSIDPAPLWDRVVPLTVAGVPLLALSPEDALLHACVHTSYHHRFEFGLRPFCDIAAIIATAGSSLDWAAVRQRSDAWRWRRGTYMALRLARELVGAGVPDDVLASLSPPGADTAADAAREQVFASQANLVEMGGELAQLKAGTSLSARIRHAGSRLFVSRRQMAAFYAVPADSPLIWWCYVLRAGYLVRRYGRMALKMFTGRDAEVATIVDRKNTVRDWLAGSS